jgi:hypothetical protein
MPSAGRFRLAWLVLLWRFAALPLNGLWRDWIAVLAVYCILAGSADPRRRPALAVCAMAFLFGIALQGQGRHLLWVLGFGP